MKRVLITGAGGQLGTALVHRQGSYQIYPLNRDEMNITNLQQVLSMFNQIHPDIVIHTAAYTNVDQSEINRRATFEINYLGTENITIACKQWDCVMVYLSTDYVFDGTKEAPYIEKDHPNPLNWYGKTKLMGEEVVESMLNRYFIVRTSWLYGLHGKKFVHTILDMAKNQVEIKVVMDQRGCPTYVEHLSEAIYHLIETGNYGLYHISNEGYCSWYDFAVKILENIGYKEKIIPITTKELNRLATRPQNSSLMSTKSIYPMPTWQVGLQDFLKAFDR